MNKKVLGVFVSLLVVGMLALPMSAAYATKPTTVTWISTRVTAGTPDYRQAGSSDNWVLTTQGVGMSWVGDITGSGTYEGRWVLHDFDPGPPPSAGAVNVLGIYTMDVTYDGESGSLTVLAGGGENWRILSGTGGLENLRGHGTLEAIVPIFVYRFTGQVHFDPN